MTRLEAPEPAGFGNCKACGLSETAPPGVCAACIRGTVGGPDDNACAVCDQAVRPGESCINTLCASPDRQFHQVRCVAYLSGELYTKIADILKLDRSKWGWARVMSRGLVARMDELYGFFEPDLVVANPANPSREFNQAALLVEHMEHVVAHSNLLGPMQFDDTEDSTIVRVRDVPSMQQLSRSRRHWVAVSELRPSLRVVHPGHVAGRHVVVVDDVFTGGATLNEVARALREAGATRVDGLVVGRAVWSRR